MTVSLDYALAETMKCEMSFPYFFFTYGRIKSDRGSGVIPVTRWPYLEEIAETWQGGGNFVEGKARQLGYSWALAHYDNWILRFRKNARILSISIGQRESGELLDKVKFVHSHLPSFLRLKPHLDNETEFGLLKTGSSMLALPSTKSAGRGEKATLVQTDEWAFHGYAGENFSAYRNAIADGGQHIAVSTGNGPSGMFYDYFQNTPDTYTARFNPWSSRPDRDQEWYDRELEIFTAAGDRHPLLFIRENPSSIEEMFTAFYGLVYDMFKPETHMVEPEFSYRDAKWRIAGIDPGQGDPAAITVVGESDKGQAHVFGPVFYQQGITTAQDIYEYLKQWYDQAPLHAVVVDGAEGTLIATLNAWFARDYGRQPVVAANKDRGIGIGLVAGRLRNQSLTIDSSEKAAQKEFQSYRWKERTAAGEADPYTTSTPVEHHGDIMDTIRYGLMYLAQFCANSRRKVVGQPAYDKPPEPAKKLVKPNADGVWVDPESRRLHDIKTPPSAKVITRSGYRPDYRARMGRMTGRR